MRTRVSPVSYSSVLNTSSSLSGSSTPLPQPFPPVSRCTLLFLKALSTQSGNTSLFLYSLSLRKTLVILPFGLSDAALTTLDWRDGTNITDSTKMHRTSVTNSIRILFLFIDIPLLRLFNQQLMGTAGGSS